jgi:hypothetical protein
MIDDIVLSQADQQYLLSVPPVPQVKKMLSSGEES